MKKLNTVLSIAGLLSVSGIAAGAIVDLTQANSFGVVNGARFETADFQSAGTGLITPMVRIQANGEEQGYNTSGRPVAFDEKTDRNFTRDAQIGDLPIVDFGGAPHYAFLLDINESNGGDKSLLSLDELRIFTSPDGGKTTSTIASLGTLRYDLDAGTDSWIRLDADLSSGSGQGDMAVLVPVSAFGGAPDSNFVYLYSKFGTNITADGGFEEWGFIPAPAPLALAGMGAFVVLLRQRFQRYA